MSDSITLSEAEIALFTRLNNAVIFQDLKLSQFWKTPRLCVTFEEFQLLLSSINQNLNKYEQELVKKSSLDFISLDRLIFGVEEWQNQETNVATYLAKLRDGEKNSPNRKGESHKKKSKPRIDNGLNLTTEISENSGEMQTHQQRQKKQYLKLHETMHRTKNESDYQITIKVGELNDICIKLQNGLFFQLISKGNELEIVQINKKQSQQQVISRRGFERKYEKLKLEHNNIIDSYEEENIEEDLRKTLVEVMYCSSELEKHIELLTRKGVSH